MYLFITEDGQSYRQDYIDEDDIRAVLDGILDVFRFIHGRFEYLADRDSWQPVEEL